MLRTHFNMRASDCECECECEYECECSFAGIDNTEATIKGFTYLQIASTGRLPVAGGRWQVASGKCQLCCASPVP